MSSSAKSFPKKKELVFRISIFNVDVEPEFHVCAFSSHTDAFDGAVKFRKGIPLNLTSKVPGGAADQVETQSEKSYSVFGVTVTV